MEADPSLNRKCLVCTVREAIEKCSLWLYVREQIDKQHEQNHKHHQEGLQKQQHNHQVINHQQEMCLCWSTLIEEVFDNKLLESTTDMCCNVSIQPSSCHLRRFNLAHYVVIILLSWPYDQKISPLMASIISTELSNTSEVLTAEVVNVRNHFLKTQLATQSC
jgi:hypothetical protein